MPDRNVVNPRLVPIHVFENFNGDGAVELTARGVALGQIRGGAGVMA